MLLIKCLRHQLKPTATQYFKTPYIIYLFMLFRAPVSVLSLCNSRACKFASYSIEEDLHIYLELLIVKHAQTKPINSRVFWTLNASVNKPSGLLQLHSWCNGWESCKHVICGLCLLECTAVSFFSALKMLCSLHFKSFFEDICHVHLLSCIFEA